MRILLSIIMFFAFFSVVFAQDAPQYGLATDTSSIGKQMEPTVEQMQARANQLARADQQLIGRISTLESTIDYLLELKLNAKQQRDKIASDFKALQTKISKMQPVE